MTSDEERIEAEAISFAKANKKKIAARLTDLHTFQREDSPVAVFMAGSPGAGKTEASEALLSLFSDSPCVRIDPDALRAEFEAYTGGNAWLFQSAVSILVEKILDNVHAKSQSFLLDGTLSNYRIAKKNVERCLQKGRHVQILYVYQDTLVAWNFVQKREVVEGRRIPVEHFVDQYFSARDVVNRLKLKYGRKVHIDLLIRHTDNTCKLYKVGVDKIDYHIPERYMRASLEAALRT